MASTHLQITTTFRDNFEKIYIQSTPTTLLPDLLKNNFLWEPALTLVKSIENIDDIWLQLRTAYGDTKILLTKKIQTLSRCDLSRSRDPEKLHYALSHLHKHSTRDNSAFKEAQNRTKSVLR